LLALSPNLVVGVCNIWVNRRRNVIYLYNKKFHLDQLFSLSTFADMMSSGELQISFSFVFCTKSSSNDIISGNFDSEKVDQDEVFYCKDSLHFFFE
jgi:hypothetical protein